MEPILIVHGGAGDISDSKIPSKIRGVKIAATEGYKVLKNGGSVLDAVETAVRILEDDESMNAGRGSVLNVQGEVEMDASIMLGSTLASGAVTVVKDIAHPISLARMVMEKTKHVLLAGEGAKKFAIEQGVEILPSGSLVTESALNSLKQCKTQGTMITEIFEGVGTVGAVAIDSNGRLAAATSTGGMSGKMVGRSSDTSLIGCGTYADDKSGAVSTTGHGESIIKFCLANSIVKAIEQGMDAQKATISVMENMTKRLNNTAGAITISNKGEVGVGFTTKKMPWAYRKGNQMFYGYEMGRQEEETVQ